VRARRRREREKASMTSWLEELGVGQYAQVFASQSTAFAIISDLTEADLEKPGIGAQPDALKLGSPWLRGSVSQGTGREKTRTYRQWRHVLVDRCLPDRWQPCFASARKPLAFTAIQLLPLKGGPCWSS
jgi:hypothetical protein